MKAALSHSHTPLPSRTDFISRFLLPILCHSWAKLMDSWLLPGLCVQARRISAWKAPSESECHRIRKGKTKKSSSWQPHAVSKPHTTRATHGKNVTNATRTHTKPHFDLDTHQSVFNILRHCQLLCFAWQDCAPRGRHVQRIVAGPRRENYDALLMHTQKQTSRKNKSTLFLEDLHQTGIWKKQTHTHSVFSGMRAIITWLFCSLHKAIKRLLVMWG